MRVRIVHTFLCAWVLFGLTIAPRCGRAAEMDELVVTGTHVETAWATPRSVTVITATDIQRSTSNNLVDLLAQEANVNLRSFFGNDKFATIDIRGMGESASSNVLVLIDGVRINAVDLSGADFSSIPLDQVERIEVVRGANTVRYGNGAVGGVINIRTKRAEDGNHAALRLHIGGFDSHGAALAASSALHGLSLTARSSSSDSAGYRENGDFTREDGRVELRYDGLEWLDAFASAQLHHDRYGLPGPVSRADFFESSRTRRASNAPHDEGETTDRRYLAGATLRDERFGQLAALASYRVRDNPFIIGFSPLLTPAEQQNSIAAQQREFQVSHTLPYSLFGLDHELVFGYERQAADYQRREDGRGLLDRSHRRLGGLLDNAGYVSSRWALPRGFSIEAGYRFDAFHVTGRSERLRRVCDTTLVPTVVETTVFVEIAPGVVIPIIVPVTVNLPVQSNCRGETTVARQRDQTWHNQAWEAGVSYQPVQWATLFVSRRESFRNPNVDELTLATTDLRPQHGQQWELGVRLRHADGHAAALSVFEMRNDDEIFFGYDLTNGREVNRNLDERSTRRGVELELKAQLGATLQAFSNMSYIDARLGAGNAFMPLVPRAKIVAGLVWDLRPDLSLSASCGHSSARFDGNDFDNQSYHKLAAYQVVDARLQWQLTHFALGLSVNNALDETYATTGYSDTIYPMPSRSVMLEFSLDL
jgi:iron complex outermembrane receptor protein